MAEYFVSLSLLTAVVFLLRAVFRRHISPRAIYALWLVVVIRLCLPFSLFEVQVTLPGITHPDTAAQRAGTGAVIETLTASDTAAASQTTNPDIMEPDFPDANTATGMEAGTSVPSGTVVSETSDPQKTPVESAQPKPSFGFWDVVNTVWFVGSVILALWFLITGSIFHRKLTANREFYTTTHRTNVYISREACSACLAGLIPSIYITPDTANSSSQALINEHEHTHLRHGDHIWAVVRILALTIHWWNPLIWAAAFFSKRDAELACDAAVAAKLNEECRLQYAHIIIDTIPQKRRRVIGLGSAPMKERIVMLTRKRKNSRICLMLASVLAITAMAGAFTTVYASDEGENLYVNEVSDEVIECIDKNLDIFIGGIIYMSEEAYFQAYPDAIAEIVALGEDALPYLLEIGGHYADYGRYTLEQTRCFLAMAAAYKISADTFDIVSVSPDGNLVFRAKVNTFFTLMDGTRGIEYKGFTITNTKTGKILLEGPETVYAEGMYNIDPAWSSDSRYLIYHLDTGDSGQTIKCIDTQDTDVWYLPHIYWPHNALFRDAIKSLNLKGDIQLVKLHQTLRAWDTERKVIVDVTMEITVDGETQYISGEYTYDVPYRRIKNASFQLDESSAVIKKTVDQNLDILISDSAADDYTTEQQFIDAHPEAFDAIVALGEAALPYLNEVIERYPLRFGNYGLSFSDAYQRSILATAAAYAIDPEPYDLIYASPDQTHALRASVESFYGFGDSFTGIQYSVSLINCETGEVLVSTTGNTNLSMVKWSDDSRYVAVTERLDPHLMDSQVIIYDVEHACTIPMPYLSLLQEINQQTGPFQLRYMDISFGGWTSSDTVKINISIGTRTTAAVGTITGHYIYDLSHHEILELNHTFKEDSQ